MIPRFGYMGGTIVQGREHRRRHSFSEGNVEIKFKCVEFEVLVGYVKQICLVGEVFTD